MKKAIFTYHNRQISPKIVSLQQEVVEKFSSKLSIDYKKAFYSEPDGVVYPDNVIDVYLNELFYQHEYDVILILDIDCIPLNTDALETTFEMISHNWLVGNAQRSHHLDNNQHIFCGASCVGISKQLYEELGKPSAEPNSRSDICEEYTWLAEEAGKTVKFFKPLGYQKLPYNETKPWALNHEMNSYGIGTTFCYDDIPFYYHLFQSRLGLYDDLFIRKCESILR